MLQRPKRTCDKKVKRPGIDVDRSIKKNGKRTKLATKNKKAGSQELSLHPTPPLLQNQLTLTQPVNDPR